MPEAPAIGKSVHIGAFTFLGAQAGIAIKKCKSAAAAWSILRARLIYVRPYCAKRACKIRANSDILPNVAIEENAVVGTCSLVKQDALACTLAGGIPVAQKKQFRSG